ncbi:MAG: FtsX-like permease family protein, partial [Coprobacillus sp.]
MKHFFYPRLAFTNIKKNAKLYIPYLITSMFTVSMYYIMHSLSVNTSFINDPNSSGTLLLVLNLGTWVMMIFSIIFLFYINSFLIKRRKKEIALYNILGMEKRHVMIMMFCETFITTLISIVGGLLLGLLLSKLAYLFLVNLIHVSTAMAFEISIPSVIQTLCIFIPIYVAAYLFNVVQVKVSNPIELLRGGEVGERQPKSKWILTIFGLIALGTGYYIAQNTQDPIMALMLFFVAVILVIIGTYCLFTAGSISILNLLKKNKKFYYQTRHFTSVSQMMYRMKQNAVGLASICILYTCILVMLSSTVSLYVSIQDSAELSLDE